MAEKIAIWIVWLTIIGSTLFFYTVDEQAQEAASILLWQLPKEILKQCFWFIN